MPRFWNRRSGDSRIDSELRRIRARPSDDLVRTIETSYDGRQRRRALLRAAAVRTALPLR